MHAVARLRAQRLARSSKPFTARGGSRLAHCPGCRLVLSHCCCALRQTWLTQAGFCLLMHDIEPLKPSNTGWLVADIVADTYAFGWARTQVAAPLLALLQDPCWQPYLVFPGEDVAPERLRHDLATPAPARRPLFLLLDGTWAEARKMFRHSPYLESLPVLHLQGAAPSQYRLRHSPQAGHWCTSEVAARCLALAGDTQAGAALQVWLDLFCERYARARDQLPPEPDSAAQQQWQRLQAVSTGA
ncbi:tRNA-uridine aminocarboxypropyltransferase [Melaminivora sp.]